MSISEIYLIVPNPVLSGLIWFFALSAVLYLARLPAKKYILAFSEVIHNAMRLAASSVNSADCRLQARNREVLLEAGREGSYTSGGAGKLGHQSNNDGGIDAAA